MGYRKIPTIYTLDSIPDEDGLVVRMRSVQIGKIRRLIRIVDAGDDANEVETLDQIFGLFLDGLVSWNLEDADGKPVPTTKEGLDDQEMGLVLSILNEWLTAMSGPTQDLGKGSPSGENFPGRPLTMEAL